MKPFLLAFIFLNVFLAAQAQTVLVKDSVTDNLKESFGYPGEATVYTYDSICRLVSTASPRNRMVYSYYPNSNHLYQATQQIYEGNVLTNTWIWRTVARLAYTYNEAGNITSTEYGYWDTLSGTFPGSSKDTFFYNQNNYKIKSISQSWDKTSQSWTENADTTFSYNSTGQTDSLVINSNSYPQKTIVRFTYYSSGKLYSETTFFQQYNDSSQTFVFYDSTSYVSKDSVVSYGRIGGDSLVPVYIGTHTTYYNENNYKVEELFLTLKSALLSSVTSTKIYYTYGPCSAAFPVTFLAFSGSRHNNNVVLNWQTANEINTSSFSIQKSTDGVHFITIGSVSAAGNGSKSYTYTDVGAFVTSVPALYYRMAERDNDGSIHYSTVASLKVAAGKLLITVSPNPVTNTINLYSSDNQNNAIITVNDMQGRPVYFSRQTISAGRRIIIDASCFAKGMYMITVRSGSYKGLLKIVKE